MRNINAVLDTAKKVHKIASDYKLAMYLGVGDSNLRNYRHGRSLPDAKVCSKLASALGEKPELLMVEMQAQRENDPEARTLWENLAKRLQSGFASVLLLLFVAIASVALLALPALSALYLTSFSAGQSVYYVKRLMARYFSPKALFVNFCKVAGYVPRHTHPAAFFAAR